jgi:hypothetical protein
MLSFLFLRFCVQEPQIFSSQDNVQLFHKLQKLLAILLHGDQRTELVNAITICLVHKDGGSITGFAVAGMFDDERLEIKNGIDDVRDGESVHRLVF